MRTPIVVDRRQAAPLHRQIYEQWRAGILDGRFSPGDRMPSTRELALGAARVARHGRDGVRPAHGGGLPRHAARLGHLRVPRSARHARPNRRPAGGAASRQRRCACRRSRHGWRPSRGARPPPRASSISPPTGPTFDQFPFGVWKRLVRRHLRALGPSLFQYPSNGAGHAGAARHAGRVSEPLTRRAVRRRARWWWPADRSRRSTCARGCSSIRATRWPWRIRATWARASCSRPAARASARCPSIATAWWCRRCRRRPASSTSRRRTSFRSACRCRWRAASSSWSGRARTAPSSSRTTTTASTATAARRCRRCRGSAPTPASSTSAPSPT